MATSQKHANKLGHSKLRRFTRSTLVFGALVVSEAFVGTALAVEKTKDNLVFEDQFSSLSRWQVDETLNGGGNNEFQYYTKDSRAVSTEDGHLHVRPGLFEDLFPTAEEGRSVMTGACNCDFDITDRGCDPNETLNELFFGCKRRGGEEYVNPVYSGRLVTKDSFSFTYGRAEARMKMPKGDWISANFWIASENEEYGAFPLSGLVTIAAVRGNDDSFRVFGERAGRDTVMSAVHYGPELFEDQYLETRSIQSLGNNDFTQSFTVFGLSWSPTRIYTYYLAGPREDEEVIISDVEIPEDGFFYPPLGKEEWAKEFDNPWANGGQNAPYDKPFYLVLTLAVGGNERDEIVWGEDAFWRDQSNPMKLFYQNKDDWYPTWDTEDGWQVDWVRVWQDDGEGSSSGSGGGHSGSGSGSDSGSGSGSGSGSDNGSQGGSQDGSGNGSGDGNNNGGGQGNGDNGGADSQGGAEENEGDNQGGDTDAQSGGSNTGAIIGGVLGGLAIVAALVAYAVHKKSQWKKMDAATAEAPLGVSPSAAGGLSGGAGAGGSPSTYAAMSGGGAGGPTDGGAVGAGAGGGGGPGAGAVAGGVAVGAAAGAAAAGASQTSPYSPQQPTPEAQPMQQQQPGQGNQGDHSIDVESDDEEYEL